MNSFPRHKSPALDMVCEKIRQRIFKEMFPYVGGRLLEFSYQQKPFRDYFPDLVQDSSLFEQISGENLDQGSGVYGFDQKLPFESAAFDTIICVDTLEHVADHQTMLKEMNRVLKKTGFLALTVPHIWGLHQGPADFFRYTKHGIKYLLEQSGLEIVSIVALSGFWLTFSLRFCCHLALKSRLPKVLLNQLITFSHNVGERLDKAHYLERETWGYVVIARKESDCQLETAV